MLEGACPSDEPSNCAKMRGSIFSSNASSTWSELGIYELLLTEERSLGLDANGSFGFDHAALGLPGYPNMPSLNQTVIGAFMDTSIYVGTLGLYPRAINLSSLNDPHQSFMGALRNQSSIPSTSWAYTAGANYRQPTAFGSLTLGGYDTTRFVRNNVSFSFGPDQSRDLVVGLQSIYSNNVPLLTNGIYAFLDSLVPDIWLPMEVCRLFEKAFGLSYNSTAERYFVNETTHSKLVSQNPNITFTLGPSSSGGRTVDITMEYGSFDLSYEDVKSGHQSYYFPLRQAQNESMYTLGRAFFQDAYVIADYDRANFSVSQVNFANNSNAQNIIAIRPPGAPSFSTSERVPIGTIAGVAASAVVVTMVAGVLTGFWRRRRRDRRTKDKSESESEHEEKSQPYHGNELSSSNTRYELDNSLRSVPELESQEKHPSSFVNSTNGSTAELSVGNYPSTEVLGDTRLRAELPGDEASELEGRPDNQASL